MDEMGYPIFNQSHMSGPGHLGISQRNGQPEVDLPGLTGDLRWDVLQQTVVNLILTSTTGQPKTAWNTPLIYH